MADSLCHKRNLPVAIYKETSLCAFMAYLVIHTHGILQMPLLLFLIPILFKLFLADFTNLKDKEQISQIKLTEDVHANT